VRIDQRTFDAYCASLAALIPPDGVEVHLAFVADDDGALRYPDDAVVLPAPARPKAAEFSVDEGTHRWTVDTFEHLARCKQLLLDYACQEGFTHVFLVDSDILLEPTTLKVLYSDNVDVVSAAFWTRWSPEQPEMPQCWLQHPYGLAGLGMEEHEYLGALRAHQLVRVLGGGACTLVRCSVLDRLRYHPRLTLPEGGMWQGEDRTFAVLCQHHHIRQYADGWPRVHHAYRPSDRTAAALTAAAARLDVEQQLYAKPGDWVAVRITPLEDPALDDALCPTVRNARFRLGRAPIAAELERAILATQVGTRAIVDIAFSAGSEVYPPGIRRLVQLEVVDIRPHEEVA
jgi:hypothetical protein